VAEARHEGGGRGRVRLETKVVFFVVARMDFSQKCEQEHVIWNLVGSIGVGGRSDERYAISVQRDNKFAFAVLKFASRFVLGAVVADRYIANLIGEMI
jgi:hypothetical protein